MGLRINTNISSLRALRQLTRNDNIQAGSLEKLATGLRINRASDDPAGLVISEQLRGQLSALNRAVENSQTASNLIATADAAIQEISNLLSGIQSSLVFVQNTGGNSVEQINAEQNVVDQAISSIDRIAATTRFAGRNLINGTAEFLITASSPAQLNDIRVHSASFAPGSLTRTLSLTISRLPERAEINFATGASSVGATVLRITGPKGTEDVAIGSGTNESGLARAINTVSQFTGVFASSTATTLRLFSEGYGQGQLVRLEVVSGILRESSTIAASAGSIRSDRGLDAQITFEGQTFTGVGNKFSILTRVASFEFSLNPDPGAGQSLTPGITTGATVSFTVGNTGLNFQLNENPSDTDRIATGIPNLSTSVLGFKTVRDLLSEAVIGGSAPSGNVGGITVRIGGVLNSIKTGGTNSLINNPTNATFIVRSAINQVATARGRLGSIQAGSIQPNITAVGVHIEQLSSSLSTIRDLDFAEETARFTRNQILYQSSIATLAAANTVPQGVLALLR